MGNKRKTRAGIDIRKKAAVWKTALLLTVILLMAGCKYGWEEGGAKTDTGEKDFFAYTDEENRLYLWKQGIEEPVLLTNNAFVEDQLGISDIWEEESASEADLGEEEPEAKELRYWEEWDYWQEWDDTRGDWVWNHERVLGSVLKEGLGELLYFPKKMRWEKVRMKRSSVEREEAQKYSSGETVDAYADVRLFMYDLYEYDGSDAGMSDGDRERAEVPEGKSEPEFQKSENGQKIADDVIFYQLDGRGKVWYCRVEEEKREEYEERKEETVEKESGVEGIIDVEDISGTGDISDAEETSGEKRRTVKTILYRYDGKESVAVAEINGRKKDGIRVSQDGEYVIFYDLDNGLYICKPGEEAVLLAEEIDTDMFSESGIYTDDNMNRIIYMEDSAIHIIEDRKKEKEWKIEGTGEYLMAGMLGDTGDRIFTLSVEEETPYTDWIVRGEGIKDESTKQLWELLEKNNSQYPVRCYARIMDISAKPAKCVQEEEGYLLSWPSGDNMETPHKVYGMEMIPADSLKKVQLSRLLGEDTAADVLQDYEERSCDEFYREYYGEENEENSLFNALNEHLDTGLLSLQAQICVVTEKEIRWIEEYPKGIGVISSEYGESGERLYMMSYRHVEQQESGYPFTFFSGYLEDWFMLDQEGNCEMWVEAADETAIRGDELFYTRKTGLEGKVSLYRSSTPSRIAKAEEIPVESIRKFYGGDAILFLAEGIIEEALEEESPEKEVSTEEKFKNEASEKEVSEEEKENSQEEAVKNTLLLCDENGVRELEKDVDQYGFYGPENVWILMEYKEQEEAGQVDADEWGSDDEWWSWEEDEEDGMRKGGSSLYVYENGEKKQIAQRAVWMLEPAKGKQTGDETMTVSWVFE